MNNDGPVLRISPGSVVMTLVIIALAAIVFVLRELILVILAAIVLASAIEPIKRWFLRYRVPRVPAVIIIYIILAFIFVGVFYFLLIPLMREVSNFLSDFPQYADQIKLWSPFGFEVGKAISFGDIIGQINSAVSSASQSLLSTISFVFGGVLSFVLIIVLSFYLAVQENGIKSFLRTVTPIKHRDYVLDVWRRAERKIGLWMQGQVLLVVIVGVLTYLGLSLLEIEHALLLAVLAGLFEIIPLFGPILSAIPAIAIAFIGGGITPALLVAGLYIIIQQFENHLIYPLVVEKVVGVSAIIVIIALVAGATLAGFLGMILSVPVAVVLMELFVDLQHERAIQGKKNAKK